MYNALFSSFLNLLFSKTNTQSIKRVNQEIISKLNSIEGLKEAQKIANEDVPYIGLYRDKGTILLNANVGGEFAPNNYFVYYNFNKWFRQQ